MVIRSEIEKLEDSPFKAAFTEWSRLSTLLSKYYSETFLNAINPDTGRCVALQGDNTQTAAHYWQEPSSAAHAAAAVLLVQAYKRRHVNAHNVTL